MLIADLRPILPNKFVQVFDEFVPLCGQDFQAASFLSNLFWWSEVADKTPEKHGWVYKTAANLKKELGLARRGYERVRRILLEKGLVQYRRGGVHGKMHWYLNRETLLAEICKMRGIAVPEQIGRFHHDRDNFRLPKFVPLDLWQSFIDGVAEKTKTSLKRKKGWLRQLAELHGKGLDLRHIMQKSIDMGWMGFYADEGGSRPSEKDLQQQAERTRRELAEQMAEREKQAKPPPDKPDKSSGSGYEEIQKFLKKTNNKAVR